MYAELVAQHIPQVQAMFTPPSNQVVAAGSAASSGVVPSAQVVAAPASSTNLNNPFLDPTTINQGAASQIPAVGVASVPVQSAMTNGAVHSVASSNPANVAQQLHISTQPSADDLECFIPGCGKPVHVDAKGMKTSDYCSMRHREYVIFILFSLVSLCLSLRFLFFFYPFFS